MVYDDLWPNISHHLGEVDLIFHKAGLLGRNCPLLPCLFVSHLLTCVRSRSPKLLFSQMVYVFPDINFPRSQLAGYQEKRCTLR